MLLITTLGEVIESNADACVLPAVNLTLVGDARATLGVLKVWPAFETRSSVLLKIQTNESEPPVKVLEAFSTICPSPEILMMDESPTVKLVAPLMMTPWALSSLLK